MNKTKPDALIFDLDGTLWDAVETYTLAWNQYFAHNDIDKQLKKSDLDNLMGLQERAFLEIVLSDFPENERADRYKEVVLLQYDLIDQIGGSLYPGVIELFPLLAKQYKLFIVSNCPEFTIRHFMKYARLKHLITDSIAHGQNYKAKYENILSLISTYQLTNPVYIGDTQSDREQSAKAGIPFVFMNYGFGHCDKFDRSFNSFKEFAKFYLSSYI